MPPKRKRQQSASARPVKKAKVEKKGRSKQKSQPVKNKAREENQSPAKQVSSRKRTVVQWAYPENINDTHLTALALLIFQGDWYSLENALEGTYLPLPAIRSPFYEKNRAKPYQLDEKTDKNRSSDLLRDFYNDIARQTQRQIDKDQYSRQNILDLFNNGNDDTAVVANAHRGGPVVLEDNSHVVGRAVTIEGDVHELKETNIDFFRFDPPGERAEYFIRLPPTGTTSVTVNGRSFESITSDLPLWIGPLTDFAVIELVGDPILFWRNTSALGFTKKRNSASQEEIDMRPNNVLKDSLRVIWTVQGREIGTDPPVLRTPQSKSSSRPPRLKITASVTSKSTNSAKSPTPSSSKANSKRASNPPAPTIPEASLPSIDTDPCGYFRKKIKILSTHYSTILEDYGSSRQDLKTQAGTLIQTVVHAINIIKPRGQGFSTFVDDQRLRALRPGRPILMPLEEEEHPVLLFARYAASGIELQILDPMHWSATRDIRDRIYRRVVEHISCGWMYPIPNDIENSEVPNIWPRYATWVSFPQQKDAIHSIYFVILYAWAMAMGFTTDADFRVKNSKDYQFYEDALTIFKLVGQCATVDWKLLFAFFRCHGFIKETSTPEDAKFWLTNTSADLLLAGEINADDNLRATDLSSSDDTMRQVRFNPSNQGQRHDEEFQADLYSEAFKTGPLLDLIRIGRWSPDLSEESAKQILEDLQRPRPPPEPLKYPLAYTQAEARINDDIPDDFDPCKYLGERLQELMKTEGNWSSDKRMQAMTNELVKGKWLAEEDLIYTIGSVTMAITAMQEDSQGFSILHPILSKVEGCSRAIRPGRPLIAAVTHANHSTLFVVQYDEDSDITLYNLDSKRGVYLPEERSALYNLIWHFVTINHWYEHSNDENVEVPHKFRSVQCVQQTDDWGCGYYTILNGWALAMGLELNTNFQAAKLKEIHPQLRRIILSARAGFADWKLIYAFLRCHDYVMPGSTVPPSRRFQKTQESLDNMSFSAFFDRICAEEQGKGEKTVLDVSANRTFFSYQVIHNLSSHPHRWELQTESTQVLKLKPFPDFQSTNGNWKAKMQAKRFQEKSKAYLYFEKVKVRLEKKLWESERNRPRRGSLEQPTTAEKWNAGMLSHHQIMLAIAAVLKPLDALQNKNKNGPTRGFALARDVDLTAARHKDFGSGGPHTVLDTIRVVRPRRCWFIPLAMTGDFNKEVAEIRARRHGDRYMSPRDHHLLALVQEEQPSPDQGETGPQVSIYFLDNMPEYFEDVRSYTYATIERIVTGLSWLGSGSPDQKPKFDGKFRHVKVAEQALGSDSSTTCGWHVIANAWILAMGLSPNVQDFGFDTDVYEGIHFLVTCALEGILGWKAVAAYFISRRLVLEETSEKVPLDRRFEPTGIRMDKDELQRTVQTMIEQDEKLGFAVPSNRDSNVKLSQIKSIAINIPSSSELRRAIESDSALDFLGDWMSFD
ncbi:hypothetical protein BS50DRAFT_650848 [Corynespora cassiicola Philippines]|uniref:Ubiquitin-like protease family profile domain-containing protein n=1 Tax=Corynespora cassiicola Philippines TaxID=1448308 RepID=A0A2T2NB91_CORCC|nr:hypothetical protein BS50DRAFT_650848 [Corynespora cassiicola Philippines]